MGLATSNSESVAIKGSLYFRSDWTIKFNWRLSYLPQVKLYYLNLGLYYLAKSNFNSKFDYHSLTNSTD